MTTSGVEQAPLPVPDLPAADLVRLEPAAGAVVAWYHQYDVPGGGKTRYYTYCAIRIDSPDPRRWFISGGSNAIRGSAPVSPASFDQIVAHADGPIQVCTGWTTLGA